MDMRPVGGSLEGKRRLGGAAVRFFFKCLAIFKMSLMERMAYRLNFFMEILSEVLSSLIVIFLWLAVYRSAGRGVIGGYSLEEMMTYLLGCGLINTFILTTAENSETSYNIQDGTLSQLFLQPISPYQVWLIRDLGGKVFYFLLPRFHRRSFWEFCPLLSPFIRSGWPERPWPLP
jgi:ABC-type uncharacterized transport system permease subunit